MLDFDGVVVDSLEAFAASLIAACDRFGIGAVRTVADVVELFAGNVYESLRATGVDERRVVEAVKAAVSDLEPVLPRLRPFPGMPEVIGRLALRSDVVIVTSNEERLVRRFLADNDVRGVEAIAGVESGLSKLEKIRVVRARYEGQPTYPFVSDTAGDIREARDAGVTPIGVGWGWHDRERLLAAGATHVVDSPKELLDLLAPSRGGG